MADSALLLISCPDQQGLVATVTQFIFERNGNILHLDQHVDKQEEVFFMRVEWELQGFSIPKEQIATVFEPLATQFNMTWTLRFSDERLKMAIFVSKQSHALYDVLSRWQSGEFVVDIPLIISNHPNMQPVAEQFGVPYHHFPITKATKAQVEQEQIALLETFQPDFIVLARYMQILTEDFVKHYPQRIINIHHSFLPAFIGAKPYHQAFARGVKIIGATSHYVTPNLDAGPIIEQDVARVTHRDSVRDMIRKGKDLEKTVLSRAIYYYINHRILAYDNKTVIF
ncbi:MAG: formyltetrahydrofolate deformylase [Chloroflexota bacterium]